MSESGDLFPPNVEFGRLGSNQNGCQAPIGRGRYRRPRLSRPLPPSPPRRELHQLAVAIETFSGLLLDVGAALERITAELATSAHERRQANEKLDGVLRQFVEFRRGIGVTALHLPERHTRRRPLGL